MSARLAEAACQPRHLALVGVTASGKSALALEVARHLGGIEVVSVDSMQVYRGMDIGTAKPTPQQREEIPHHLLDLADPGERYSVAEFQAAASSVLAEIEVRGHRALLVGGTGLYLQALVDGLNLPGAWPEIRDGLEAQAVTPAGLVELYRRLVEEDPVAAARIEVGNARRIVRALEVTLGSGRRFSSFGPGLGVYRPSRFRMVALWLPRAVVAERIERRYRAQVAEGFVDEVRALAARPGGLSPTAGQALGYREILEHLAGSTTLDEALVNAAARTRRFARRQRSWFRRDPRITWLAAGDNPFDVLPALLGDWKPR